MFFLCSFETFFTSDHVKVHATQTNVKDLFLKNLKKSVESTQGTVQDLYLDAQVAAINGNRVKAELLSSQAYARLVSQKTMSAHILIFQGENSLKNFIELACFPEESKFFYTMEVIDRMAQRVYPSLSLSSNFEEKEVDLEASVRT